MKEITSPNDTYILEGTASISAANKIYYATSPTTTAQFRLKVTPKFNIGKSITEEQHQTDVKIWKSVAHDGILSVIETFEDSQNYYLVTDRFSEQSLTSYAENFGILPEAKVKNIMQQIVSVFSYLHQHNIALRNLRSESFIVNRTGTVKLSDFTFATYVSHEDFLCDDYFNDSVYNPPEMILGHKYKAKAADVWSLGVLFYEIVAKRAPWEAVNPFTLAQEMLSIRVERSKRLNYIQYDLVTKMLEPDVARRYSIIQVENHLWLRKHGLDKEFRNAIKLKGLPILKSSATPKSYTSRDVRPKCLSVNAEDKSDRTFFTAGKLLTNKIPARSPSQSSTVQTSRSVRIPPRDRNFFVCLKNSAKLKDLLNIRVQASDLDNDENTP
ncbi:CAMK family protein kinase [Tritrichomonas foetus]|uniref:CAMK family protein kinase n=1 Tax=Tritrichomonas foetus TaxID=1144522 RepID=A0A1J4KVA6_9EUKA|nr:CAMK family protein kinase [Tritrichomonas foetus]|eukprot:OHT15249.1 CAMK family protein kinase [Tritrichomonas foetus]